MPAWAVCPTGWICPTDPIYTSKVGSWYTPIWQGVPGAGGPCVDHWLTESRFTPLLGHYDLSDNAIINSHRAWMKTAGIDFLLLDMTNGLGADNGCIKSNTLDFYANNDAADGGIPAGVAIGHALWSSNESTCGAGLTMQQVEANEVYTTMVRPSAGGADGGVASSYFNWKGKPLLVVFNSYDQSSADASTLCAPDWSDPRFSVGYAAGYVEPTSETLRSHHREWWGWASWSTPWLGETLNEVMVVSPGWNTSHLLREHPHGPVAREDGEYFMRGWLRSIQNNPQNIMIASWNDFAEETAIEPALLKPDAGFHEPGMVAPDPWLDAQGNSYPFLYLDIATAYGQLRTGLLPGYYYRDEDDPRVFRVNAGTLQYQSAMPSQAAVVFLPAGTLSHLRQDGGSGWNVLKTSSSPDFYLAQAGKKRYIDSIASLNRLGFSEPAQVVAASALAALPNGDPAPSLAGQWIVRASASAETVYWMDRGVKRPVHPEDQGRLFSGITKAVVADAVVDALPTGGGWLVWAVKTANSPDVYLAGNGRIRRIPDSQTLYALGYSDAEIVVVSQSTLNLYQKGLTLPSLASRVIRRSSDNRLYVLDRGTKRPTTSAALSFFGLGSATITSLSDENCNVFTTGSRMSR